MKWVNVKTIEEGSPEHLSQLVQMLQGQIKKLEAEIHELQRRKEIQFKDIKRALKDAMEDAYMDGEPWANWR
jgi:prefoldin subunit 5